jgi:hypothetical protein
MAATFAWKTTLAGLVLTAAVVLAVSLAQAAPLKKDGGKPALHGPAPVEPRNGLQQEPGDNPQVEPQNGVASGATAAWGAKPGRPDQRLVPGNSAAKAAGPGSSAKAGAPGRAASPITGSAISVDPCTFASAAKLKTLLAPYVGVLKFEYHKDGHHLTMSDPSLSDLRCPGCTIEIKAHVRYKKTRGFPQFSASGTMRASARLEARVTMNGSQLQKAEVLVKNLKVTGLNLNGVNNAIDAEIRKQMDQKLPNQLPPIDVTALVQTFLNQGGSFAASSSGKLGTNPTARKTAAASPGVPSVPKLQP